MPKGHIEGLPKLIHWRTVYILSPVFMILLSGMLSLVIYIYVNDRSMEWKVRELDQNSIDRQFEAIRENQIAIQNEFRYNAKATWMVLEEYKNERFRLVEENLKWRAEHGAEQRALRADVDFLKKKVR